MNSIMSLVRLMLFNVLSQCTSLHGHTIDDAYRLHGYLFNSSRYNIHVRPVTNQSLPIKISITQMLSSVESLDITYGFLEVSGYLDLSWQDEILIWDPASFGGIQLIPLPEGSYWKPEVTTYGITGQDDPLWTTKHAMAMVYSNGTVVRFIYANIVTKCNIDTSLFPFDSHECIFKFYFPKYLDLVEIKTVSTNIRKFQFLENFEWEIIENNTHVLSIHDPSATYKVYRYESRFLIKRRPTFILLHQFLPSFILVILNLLTCSVPLNSGERLSYSVTILLAYIFLMGTMVDALPASSLNISISSYAFVTVNAMNSLTVVWSVFCVRISLLDAKVYSIPKWLNRIVLWNTRKSAANTIHPLNKTMNDGVSINLIEDLNIEYGADNETPPNDEDRSSSTLNKTCDDKDLTWFVVASFLDKLYFIFFLTVTLILILIMLIFVIDQGVV